MLMFQVKIENQSTFLNDPIDRNSDYFKKFERIQKNLTDFEIIPKNSLV